ncbi:MAG: imidazole glycerol phosphate synthase cyclase subunit [Leptospira sp.]|nr:imidazole glycerol phosphate synthase cyclase subunit [Leptospira sp.]
MIHRVIARLDIKGPNLVKGIHLEGLRVLGSPEQFAKYYYDSGADELLYMDVVASLYNRNSLREIITRTAKEIFIPLTVGGGLRSLEDINDVLRAGADKICINTAAIKNPEIIKQASRKFGSSTIVVAIEAIQQPDGSYLAYTDNGREHTGVDVFEWARKVEALGAGEILITSVDKEGTGSGFEINLINEVCNQVSIPVIAHGGCGKKEHLLNLFQETKASAASISSILHYSYIDKHSNTFVGGEEGNIDFLKSGRLFKNIDKTYISEIKQYLNQNNIECRIDYDE